MTKDDLIKQIKTNSRLKFKNDNNIYYSKNLSLDKQNIFVTLNGLQTYRKLLKNLTQVDNHKLDQLNEEIDFDTDSIFDEYCRGFILGFINDPKITKKIKSKLSKVLNIPVDQLNNHIEKANTKELRKLRKWCYLGDKNILTEESLKNLLLKKILDSSLSKELKDKYLKQYKDSGYDYKMMKQILLKMDQPQEKLKEVIKKVLKETSNSKSEWILTIETTSPMKKEDIISSLEDKLGPDFIINIKVEKQKSLKPGDYPHMGTTTENLKEHKKCSCKH